MSNPEYIPPEVWSWEAPSGGQFANINRPVAGPTHEADLPVGKNPLQLEFDSLSADCAVAGNNDNVCAVVNRTTDNPPWPFLDKGGNG